MKVITTYPISVKRVRKFNKGYSSLDGTSSARQIREFQAYARAKGFLNTSGPNKGKPLDVDGLWGANTAAAYAVHGPIWDQMMAPVTKVDSLGTAGTAAGAVAELAVPTGGQPTQEQKKKARKLGKVWDATKRTWANAKEGGLFDSFFEKLGFKEKTADTGYQQTSWTGQEGAPAEPTKKPMSTGVKIAIAAGSVLLIGTLIYFATQKKTAAAK